MVEVGGYFEGTQVIKPADTKPFIAVAFFNNCLVGFVDSSIDRGPEKVVWGTTRIVLKIDRDIVELSWEGLSRHRVILAVKTSFV